jgi:hypothetical protein
MIAVPPCAAKDNPENFPPTDPGYRYLLPAGMDEALSDLPPKVAACCKYMVNQVNRQSIKRRDHDPEEYVQLKREFLEDVIGWRRYPCARDELIDREILECDGRFVPHAKSYGFRLTPAWRSVRKRFERCKDRILNRNVKRVREKLRLREHSTLSPVHRQLREMLNRLTLPLDLEQIRHDGEKCEVVNTLDMIRHQDWWFSVCPYGRVHTPITVTPSRYRSCLLADGEPLAEVDIKNCQPLLLSHLMTHCGVRWTPLIGQKSCRP